MIIVTSRLFDALGYQIIEENHARSSLHETNRRISRYATLDGGAQVDDAGFSDGDRTLIVVARGDPGEAVRDNLQRMLEADYLQRMATRDGVFEGAIENLSYNTGELRIRFIVRAKLSA